MNTCIRVKNGDTSRRERVGLRHCVTGNSTIRPQMIDPLASLTDGVERRHASVVTTHVSTLLFVGDLVYKFRRPVRYGFLDFSDVARRRIDCEREVMLNRRLAPDVYLGVGEVVLDGQPLEPVVIMRRLASERNFASLLRGEDSASLSRSVARLLADFHSRAERSERISQAATSDAVRKRWEANFTEIEQFVGSVFESHFDETIQQLVDRYLEGRSALFDQRIATGAICDGHGDLQAADIYCLADGPRILDCLEFDDRLRYVDVADDLSFLLMDLDRLGARRAADACLRSYEEFSGTALPPSLVDHYRAYHAYVRAKVAALSSDTQSQARREARRLHLLAKDYLERGRVRLVLVGGLPGTGKSTLSLRLADSIDAVLIRSDDVRKELARQQVNRSTSAPFREGIYSREMSRRTYATLLERATIALRLGSSVVLDASWTDQNVRRKAHDVASSTAADLYELCCVLDAQSAGRRIAARRQSGGDVSDATSEIAVAMAAQASPWPSAVAIDTSRSRAQVLREALRIVRNEMLLPRH